MGQTLVTRPPRRKGDNHFYVTRTVEIDKVRRGILEVTFDPPIVLQPGWYEIEISSDGRRISITHPRRA
jgi:hypothetical protein